MGTRAGVVLAGLVGLLPLGGQAAWIAVVVALVALVGALVLTELAAAVRR